MFKMLFYWDLILLQRGINVVVGTGEKNDIEVKEFEFSRHMRNISTSKQTSFSAKVNKKSVQS